jgi:hypothetical protein
MVQHFADPLVTIQEQSYIMAVLITTSTQPIFPFRELIINLRDRYVM